MGNYLKMSQQQQIETLLDLGWARHQREDLLCVHPGCRDTNRGMSPATVSPHWLVCRRISIA